MAWGSASGRTMPASLPPSSRVRRLTVSAEDLMMALPVAVEPVNMILPIRGVSGQGLADVAAAGDDGQDAFGEFLVQDMDEGQDGERGVFGGFDHHGVAHPQGGGELPDGDHHGPVPGPDRADDADGPVVQFGAGFAVVHHGFRVQGGGGGDAEPGGAGADLEAGVRAVERFALLAGEQAGEFLGGAFDGVGGPEERGGPGVVAQGGPRRAARPRRRRWPARGPQRCGPAPARPAGRWRGPGWSGFPRTSGRSRREGRRRFPWVYSTSSRSENAAGTA